MTVYQKKNEKLHQIANHMCFLNKSRAQHVK